MRRAALALLAAALLLGPPVAAEAALLEPQDATELAQALADAQEEQDVCYGWTVRVNGIVTDQGSSVSGPGRPPLNISCERSAIFEADLTYTCDACEAEDSASFSVESENLPDPPTRQDLEDLGYGSGDLLGDNDDVTLIDMVGALPLLVAQRRNQVPYVPYEPATGVPAEDGPTNSPGSDLLRDRWFVLVLSGGLLLFGPLWFLYKRGQQVPSRSRSTAKEH